MIRGGASVPEVTGFAVGTLQFASLRASGLRYLGTYYYLNSPLGTPYLDLKLHSLQGQHRLGRAQYYGDPHLIAPARVVAP